MMIEAIREHLRCPACKSSLAAPAEGSNSVIFCGNVSCEYSRDGFPIFDGKPALIDFEDSIVRRASLASRAGTSPIRRDGAFRSGLRGLAFGWDDSVPAQNCAAMVAELRKASERPKVLVVGGGRRGAGTAALYAAKDIATIGTDIYASDEISVIADGHVLPFADETFDGVWIQAVLEHVLEPQRVVAEIHRVLKPGGMVYAETPFMQQVHEGAYDFTRFTRSGHRWLFRNFQEVRAGCVAGPGTSLIWAIRYAVRAMTRSNKVATLAAIPFFWLRYLDRFADPLYASDGANGIYFLGRSGGTPLQPQDMIEYYAG